MSREGIFLGSFTTWESWNRRVDIYCPRTCTAVSSCHKKNCWEAQLEDMTNALNIIYNSKKLAERMGKSSSWPPLETFHMQGVLLCQHKTGCRPSCEKLQLRLRLNLFGFKFFQKQQRLFPFAPSFANRHMVECQNDNSLMATGAICLPCFHCQEQGDLIKWMCHNCLQQLQHVAPMHVFHLFTMPNKNTNTLKKKPNKDNILVPHLTHNCSLEESTYNFTFLNPSCLCDMK